MQVYPISKAPGSALDYSLDLTRWMPAGDSIATVTVSAMPSDLALGTPPHTATIATLYCSAGIDGMSYTLTWTITTVAGRTLVRHVTLAVEG